EDLATQKFALDALCKARSDVDDEADALRARLPAVHLDLAAYPATAELAGWLASASFDRFRIRLVKPVTTGATPVEPPKAQRELVTRTDRLSRALAAAQFATALLAAERGPIAEALERRAFPRTRLESFAKAARALADKLGGKVTMEGSQHTQLEAAAVAAQTARWKACRKMIARVAKSDPQLATLWAAC
ncbi:MAG: hypothetical protein MUF54_20065, partial [Polyangiaceae bacterium]|nr:hypothetical protein [Polyangiaceae bacterium]